MICNMLEKIQAEFSRLQEVDYNGTARGVQCTYIRYFTKQYATDTKNCVLFKYFSTYKTLSFNI